MINVENYIKRNGEVNMIKIAVCDDEQYFRKRMNHIIFEYMEKNGYDYAITDFESGEEFLKASSRKMDYTIVFLDVNMKEINGMETARAIRCLSADTYIVFVTAFISYVLEGYKVNALRFLLKEDVNLEGAMRECLDAVIADMNYREVRYTFDFQNGRKELCVDRILYVESRLHKVIFFVMEDGITEYYLYDKLDNIDKILTIYGFYRIHQSFLVNMKCVKKVERYRAVLLNGMELSISKKYYKEFEIQYIKTQGDI